MNIGSKVVRRPLTLKAASDGNDRSRTSYEGVVVYMHPKGRYHTVEFDVNGVKIRESFFGLR